MPEAKLFATHPTRSAEENKGNSRDDGKDFGAGRNSNIDTLQRIQSESLRSLVKAFASETRSSERDSNGWSLKLRAPRDRNGGQGSDARLRMTRRKERRRLINLSTRTCRSAQSRPRLFPGLTSAWKNYLIHPGRPFPGLKHPERKK